MFGGISYYNMRGMLPISQSLCIQPLSLLIYKSTLSDIFKTIFSKIMMDFSMAHRVILVIFLLICLGFGYSAEELTPTMKPTSLDSPTITFTTSVTINGYAPTESRRLMMNPLNKIASSYTLIKHSLRAGEFAAISPFSTSTITLSESEQNSVVEAVAVSMDVDNSYVTYVDAATATETVLTATSIVVTTSATIPVYSWNSTTSSFNAFNTYTTNLADAISSGNICIRL